MATVRFDQVSKKYGAVAAVSELSLEVASGEFLVLVGPSGSGKTTALRMLAGLESVSSGHLLIDGRVVDTLAPRDRDIAMVFQDYALYPQMTVAKNLGFGLKMRRVGRWEVNRRVLQVAEMLGIQDYLERKPGQLSGGQRQRVALGRALVREPRVFLMDEPLSNLDASLRAQMRGEIRALQQRVGTTTVYVTHDQVEAMTMGDRIALMKDGKVMQVADPRTLYERPGNRFVAGFIGSPAMSLVKFECSRQDDELCLRSGRLSLVVPAPFGPRVPSAGEVLVGVRAEDAHRWVTGRDLVGPIAGTVSTVEAHGRESFLWADTDAGTFVVLVKGRDWPHVGERIEIGLNASALHLFDPVTGSSLRGSEGIGASKADSPRRSASVHWGA